MDCAERLHTQALIDGELTNPATAEVERHIAACPDCQAFCQDAAAVSDTIRRHAPRYGASDRLRWQVREAIAADVAELPRRSRPVAIWRRPLSLFAGGFLGGVCASGLVAAALALMVAAPPTSGALADRLVRAHTDALMAGRTIAIASSDHHTVKPWFAGKIALSPPVRDFAAEGFPLAGGRIDKEGGFPKAVLAFRHGRHEIDLFVWADDGRPLPGPTTRHGYNILFWKQKDLDLAAVSDTQMSELETFSALMRGTAE